MFLAEKCKTKTEVKNDKHNYIKFFMPIALFNINNFYIFVIGIFLKNIRKFSKFIGTVTKWRKTHIFTRHPTFIYCDTLIVQIFVISLICVIRKLTSK